MRETIEKKEKGKKRRKLRDGKKTSQKGRREGGEEGSQGEGTGFHEKSRDSPKHRVMEKARERLSGAAYLNKVRLLTGRRGGGPIHHSHPKLPGSMGKPVI